MVENAIRPTRANAMPGLLALMSGTEIAAMGRSPTGQNSGAPLERPTGKSSS
jgi:hypothetical protein